jgi:integrase
MASVNILQLKQLEAYGKDGIQYLDASATLKKYIARKGTASEASAKTIRSRINKFAFYLFKTYPGVSFDDFLATLQTGKPDPYDVLADYAAHLTKGHVKPNEVRQKVRAAKKFLKFCKIKIDNEDFRENVSLPRQESPEFDGVEKSKVVELLNSCKNQRLKTALMMFASTGCRAIEGCAVKMSDVDLEKSMITFPAKYTKMRKERTRPMTTELTNQIKLWLKVKYRPHAFVRMGGKREFVTPRPNPDDLLLAFWHLDETPKPEGIYDSIYDEWEELTKTLDIAKKNGRRVVTFHSFRRFVKSVISDLGHGDYSEWFIGHSGSTYYRKTEKERLDIFKKIEPYLTFMDVVGLEQKHADSDSKIETLQAELIKERQERERLYELLYKQGVIKKEA